MSDEPAEQIEHAQHAAHAAHHSFDRQVTISIAIIAAVLACATMLAHRAHNDTLRLQTEGGIHHSLASNSWARYQAVNVRSHLYQTMAENSEFTAVAPDAQPKLEEARKRWQQQIAKYETEQLPSLKQEAESEMQQSTEALEQSHEMHLRADRFDLGELGLQMGVVLCSLAILTKGRAFWVLGILCALAGAALALTGQLGLALALPH